MESIHAMNYSEKLLKAIAEYESYIKIGNNLLKQKYNTTRSPYLDRCSLVDKTNIIPASGELEYEQGILSYRFHGAGCCFEFGSIIVDFDYGGYDMNFEYAGFNLNALRWFIENIPDYKQLSNERVFNESINELESKGVIIRDIDLLRTNHRDYYLSEMGRSILSKLFDVAP